MQDLCTDALGRRDTLSPSKWAQPGWKVRAMGHWSANFGEDSWARIGLGRASDVGCLAGSLLGPGTASVRARGSGLHLGCSFFNLFS